jgi:hypothetical protein
MADSLSRRYQDLLDGSYDCVDRIVLNAYFRPGHSAGGFRVWWRRLTGSDDIVDRRPEKLLPPLDIDEQFVQVPPVPHLTLASPQRSRIRRPERPTPLPNRLVGDRDTALVQWTRHIAEAHTKAVVEPDGVTDDRGREIDSRGS